MTSPHPLQVHVEMDLTLDTAIGESRSGQPVTVLDAIVRETSGRLIQALREDLANWERSRDLVRKITSEMVRETLGPIIDEAINGVIQPTNSYGAPTGPATTLRAMVMDEVKRQMKLGQGGSFGDKSVYEKALRSVTADALAKELSTEITVAKKALREAAQKAAAEAIAKALVK